MVPKRKESHLFQENVHVNLLFYSSITMRTSLSKFSRGNRISWKKGKKKHYGKFVHLAIQLIYAQKKA